MNKTQKSKQGRKSPFPDVHVAKTRREMEAIYRFRYDVYFREFGRLLGRPDHERRWVHDDDDLRPTTTILYTGTSEQITATVRLQHWQPGEVPRHEIEELSMDRLPEIEKRRTAEIGRLMVLPEARGKLHVASLVRRAYEILVGEHASEMVFCYCSPGLMHFYRRIAMRPYGGRLVLAPDGLMIPMVSVTSDVDYYRDAGSFLAPMVEHFFGPDKLEILDLGPYREAFARTCVEIDGQKVIEESSAVLEQDGRWQHALLDALCQEDRDKLLATSLLVDVEPGTLVTRRGFCESELFVVLDGEFRFEENPSAAGRTTGEHFGEESLLKQSGRRTHSVRAVTAGRLLVLRGACIQKLIRRRPELTATLHRLPPKAAAPAGLIDGNPSGTWPAGSSAPLA